MILITSYQPLEDVSSTHKVRNYVQVLYYNSTKHFKWQSVHLEKYPGGIWRGMWQNRYLQDRTRLGYERLFLKADLCSHNMYLQYEKNPKEIGWIMSMLWEIPHFMTQACLWSNLRLYMHSYTHVFLTSIFWYLKNHPTESWRVFFIRKVWFAPTFQAFVHEFWVRFGYGMLKIR